jgi:NADH-ubiquinone oxidoreductase chain 4
VEEGDHFLLSFVRVMMVSIVWSSIEGGIKVWIYVTVVLIGAFFRCSSPFLVYIFLEASLIPVVILIIGWGCQRERVRAGFHFVVYTFVFSVPLFLRVVFMEGLSLVGGPFLTFFIGMAFIVKTPLFFIHVWLPKAHVEAPTAGSIVLASILLKIGGVGFV